MKVCSFVIILAVLATSSSAVAQSNGTYLCTNSSNQLVFKFGPGELRMLERNGAWSDNWCDYKGTTCGFDGSNFKGDDPEGMYFTYDGSTGEFEESDAGGGDETGVCRPG